MKNFIKISVCVLALAVAMPAMAQKKKGGDKDKKEKKEIVWPGGTKPAATGNASIDKYINTCDTMINKLKYIGESVTFYHVATIRVTNADGTVTEKRAVVDENGTIRSKNLALKQTLELIKTCTELTVSSANLALLTATYTTSLPSLGLSAIKYGKYVKIGGQLTGRCTTEMVDLMKRLRQQGKEIRAFKKSFSEAGELSDPSMDISNIDGIDFSATPVVEKSNEDFERELAEAAQVDQDNSGDVDDSLFDEEA